MKPGPYPTLCLEKLVQPKTIWFCGRPVSLHKIAKASGLSVSYLSLVFRGKRRLYTENAVLIARSLGMDVGAVIEGLKDRGPIILERAS
jgi:transcriptional regulator with XRE-family HTH domain